MPTPLQIRLIHIAKREANLDDAGYRLLLRNIADVESCKDLGQSEFEDVMAVMEDRGFRTVGQPENYWRGKVRRRDFECGERMVRKIETMAPLTDYKVPGLCMRFTHGRTDRVDRLTPGEAYCVVEMLKAAVERKESAEIYAAEIASDGATGGEEELPF